MAESKRNIELCPQTVQYPASFLCRCSIFLLNTVKRSSSSRQGFANKFCCSRPFGQSRAEFSSTKTKVIHQPFKKSDLAKSYNYTRGQR